MQRECGSCQACCYAPRLDELSKPAFTKCPRQALGRCLDYDNRPDPCRSYVCTWLGGMGGESARPDRLGAMFTARNDDQLGPWVSVHTLDPNCPPSPKPFATMLKEHTERCTVIAMDADSMRVLGGPSKQAADFVHATANDPVPVRRLAVLRQPA